MDIPKGLDVYVNDCKVHVFEVAWLTDEQISKFRSDFKVVANFFVKKRKYRDYIPDDSTEIQHVDEVLKLFTAFTGDERYEKVLNSKGQVSNMCEVAERLENIGRAEGRAEVIRNMLLKGRTPEEIADFGDFDLDEIIKIRNEMSQTV